MYAGSIHYEICRLLEDLSDEVLIKLGGQLGISNSELQRMSNFPREMVAAWLNRQDDILSCSGEPTWNVLIIALEQIRQNGIAKDVREYCTTMKVDCDNKLSSKYHGSPLNSSLAGI